MISMYIKQFLFFLLSFFPDKVMLYIFYLYKFQRIPNFKSPSTFNEKINWRKLYQRDKRFIEYSDKIRAKELISKIIDKKYIIQTLHTCDSFEEIPFDKLNPPYVIKTSHGCADTILIKSQNDLHNHSIFNSLKVSSRRTYGVRHREWAYQHIQRKILIEKMLIDKDTITPNDYKFFVYHGTAHYVQMDRGRFEKHEMAFFDRDWNKLPLTKGHPQIEDNVPQPQNFSLMIELAEAIGKNFDFVRVDLYDTPDGVFFGETTFYPAGGFGRFYPDEWDEKFGNPWKIHYQRQYHCRVGITV